jgi:hypothetical protein
MMRDTNNTDYERLHQAVEDALVVLDGYSGRIVDTAKVILREALIDGSRKPSGMCSAHQTPTDSDCKICFPDGPYMALL